MGARAAACYRSKGSEGAQRGRRVRHNRDDWLDAAEGVVLRDGPDALRTGRIAKELGVVQSGFYAHFTNMDECLAALADRIDGRVRVPLSEGMARLRGVDAGAVDELTPYFTDVLSLVRRENRLMRIFLRFRRDHSPIGQAMQHFRDRLIADLADHLDAILPPHRTAARRAQHCRAMASLLFVNSLAGIESWMADELEEEVVVRILAEQTSKLGDSARAAGMFAD